MLTWPACTSDEGADFSFLGMVDRNEFEEEEGSWMEDNWGGGGEDTYLEARKRERGVMGIGFESVIKSW